MTAASDSANRSRHASAGNAHIGHTPLTRSPVPSIAIKQVSLTPGERALLARFVDLVRDAVAPTTLERMILFGSRACATSQSDSDLEVAVFVTRAGASRPDPERAAAPALPVAPPLLPGLGSACFIEWRYWSVLGEAFHGIVGLSLVNPEQRFAGIAEGGLLLIIAGVFDRPAHPGPGSQSLFEPPPAELCWMNLFPVAACNFDQPRPGWLRAGYAHCRIELDQHSASEADLRIDAPGGLRLRLSHRGLPRTAVEPVLGCDLDRGLAGLVGSHWLVHCPSPVAASDGEIQIDPNALTALGEAGGPRLQVDNRVLHRIPLLRPHRLAVRHFFISEEIGVADWTLRDARGHIVAEAVQQSCGGEVAHFRLQA